MHSVELRSHFCLGRLCERCRYSRTPKLATPLVTCSQRKVVTTPEENACFSYTHLFGGLKYECTLVFASLDSYVYLCARMRIRARIVEPMCMCGLMHNYTRRECIVTYAWIII